MLGLRVACLPFPSLFTLSFPSTRSTMPLKPASSKPRRRHMLCSIMLFPSQVVFLVIAVPVLVNCRGIHHLRPAPVLARQGQVALQVQILIIVLGLKVLMHRPS